MKRRLESSRPCGSRLGRRVARGLRGQNWPECGTVSNQEQKCYQRQESERHGFRLRILLQMEIQCEASRGFRCYSTTMRRNFFLPARRRNEAGSERSTSFFTSSTR